MVMVVVVVLAVVAVKEEPFLTDVSQVPLRTGLCRLVSSAYRDHRWVTSCIRNLTHAPHPPRCWRLKERPSSSSSSSRSPHLSCSPLATPHLSVFSRVFFGGGSAFAPLPIPSSLSLSPSPRASLLTP
ncbi:hypothetical protein E2C01_076889 [Portunus trituberculatus]|uniref:Secreted protein n=1 Tax=Portunus trituberculatus TaxID=210409 RepID=A0A5B7IK91_PORTR|nr:hypothetical protein [Portunus trituberculatus]